MSWWYNLVTEKPTAAPRQDDILVSSIKVTCAIQFAVHLLWQFVLRGELYDIMLRHSISRTSSILRWISLVQIGKTQEWNFVEMHCDKTSPTIDQDQSPCFETRPPSDPESKVEPTILCCDETYSEGAKIWTRSKLLHVSEKTWLT